MKEILAYWPYFAIGVAVILLLIFAIRFPRMRLKARLKKQGRVGEAKVSAILKRYARIHGFKVLNDISIPLYDGTTQIDHILIGEFGLLVVETKSHKGDIYADPRAKEWIQLVGGKKQRFYNPLMQNKGHLEALRYQLQKHKIYKVPIDSIVVFSGAHKTNLYIETGHPVLEIQKLRKYLNTNQRFLKDNGVDVKQLTEFLQSIAVTDKKKLAAHDKEVAKKH
jgi:hypothetical protein